MTLLDHTALERARREAGLLPLDLARQLNASTDTTAAILARGTADEHLTLADLRRMAAAVAIHPRQLLADATTETPDVQIGAQLAALLHRNGPTSIADVAVRLQAPTDQILDALDAYNQDAAHGLKIMRWNEDIGLIADPALNTPDPPEAQDASEDAQVDQLLWQVIDRRLPADLSRDTLARLQTMATQGLVTLLDHHWRPSDQVIQALDLLDWDTIELLDVAHG